MTARKVALRILSPFQISSFLPSLRRLNRENGNRVSITLKKSAHSRHTEKRRDGEWLHFRLTDSQFSCVRGRRSNQLNYAPALKLQLLVCYGFFPTVPMHS